MNEEEIVRKSLKELANNIFSKLNDVEKSYLLMVNNEKNKQINELQQELQRKDDNWNELKRYIKASDECWDLQAVLDKMKELENEKE